LEIAELEPSDSPGGHSRAGESSVKTRPSSSQITKAMERPYGTARSRT
jgi:hypothetical protein